MVKKPEIPFGKTHRGKSIDVIPSDYLKWLNGQEWFPGKFEKISEAIEKELKERDENGGHF